MEETDVEREDCSERVRELRLETGVVFGQCVCVFQKSKNRSISNCAPKTIMSRKRGSSMTRHVAHHVITVASVLLMGLCFITHLHAFELDEEMIIQKATQVLSESRTQQEEDMRAFVGLGSVAAIESYKDETRKCAEWLASWLKDRLGMEDASLYESGYRNPVVVGSSGLTPADKDKPALVIYGHYDVQVCLPICTYL